jgi:hypothetical protein
MNDDNFKYGAIITNMQGSEMTSVAETVTLVHNWRT